MIRTAFLLTILLTSFAVTFALPQRAVFDFDGDNKSDYVVIRPESAANWYIYRSKAGPRGQAFGGAPNDFYVPGDYDGDSKWDLAIWRPAASANFYIFQSQTETFKVVPFGKTGDVPVPQDYDGDGKVDPAVMRTGTTNGDPFVWYIQRTQLGLTVIVFGKAGTDVPIRGDFDGDRKADVAIYRRTTATPSPPNTFYVLRSSDGGLQARDFGDYNFDSCLPGDFDGDGKTDYAVWRHILTGSTATWYWLNSSDDSLHSLDFGIAGDFPVPGDYDGDGKTDQAVWRPDFYSVFYVNQSTLGFKAFPYGVSYDYVPANSLQVR